MKQRPYALTKVPVHIEQLAQTRAWITGHARRWGASEELQNRLRVGANEVIQNLTRLAGQYPHGERLIEPTMAFIHNNGIYRLSLTNIAFEDFAPEQHAAYQPDKHAPLPQHGPTTHGKRGIHLAGALGKVTYLIHQRDVERDPQRIAHELRDMTGLPSRRITPIVQTISENSSGDAVNVQSIETIYVADENWTQRGVAVQRTHDGLHWHKTA